MTQDQRPPEPTDTPSPVRGLPSESRRPRRLPRVAVGVVCALSIAIGALLVVGGTAQQGYISSGPADLSTTTRALATREIDVSSRLPGDPDPDLGELGTVRIRASTGQASPGLFIGIAARSDVLRYLDTASYDEMASYQESPLRVEFQRHVGAGTLTPPANQSFWVATATGANRAELTWNKTHGEWMAVVMNADGSPGVQVTADVGLRFGFLVPTGIALIVVPPAVVFTGIALRRRRQSRSS